MKVLYTIFAVAILSLNLVAQKLVDETYALDGITSIIADFEWADVVVKNWDGPELKVDGEVLINLGENNDAHELKIEKRGNVLHLKSDIAGMKSLGQYLTIYKGGDEIHIKLKDEETFDWKNIRETYGVEAGERVSMGPLLKVSFTLLVPAKPALKVQTKYGSIEMVECSNPMNLKSTYGHLVAALPAHQTAQECSFESTYSFVDLSVPVSSGIKLAAHTNHGQIYSNLDLGIIPEQCVNEIYNSKIVGNVNNGGDLVSIEATYNNIYLRKKM